MNRTHQPPTTEAWQAFVAHSDEDLTGIVSVNTPFGAFIRFDEGVDGLLLTAQAKRGHVVGDRVMVRAVQLDADNRRVSLREV